MIISHIVDLTAAKRVEKVLLLRKYKDVNLPFD